MSKFHRQTGCNVVLSGRCGLAAVALIAASAFVGLSPDRALFGQGGVGKNTAADTGAGDEKSGFAEDQPAATEADASVPEAARSVRINFNIDVPDTTSLVLPRHPAWIIGFHENPSGGRVLVLDIRSGRRIALTAKPMDLTDPVLSGDGTLVTSTKSVWGKDRKTTVSIWNIRTMQEVSKIDFPGAGKVSVLDFIGRDRIIVAPEYQRSTPESIEVWSVDKKELVNAVPISESVVVSTLALDPAGRLLVYANNTDRTFVPKDAPVLPMLEMIDLQTGKKTPSQPEINDMGKAVPLATRFSPDGKQLAVAMSTVWEALGKPMDKVGKIVVLDVATGKVETVVEVSSDVTPFQSRFFDNSDEAMTLQWTADGKRILLAGKFLYDLDLGELVYEVPFANEAGWSTRGVPRLLLGNEYILRSTPSDSARPLDRMLKFTGARLPLDQINKSLEAVRAGGDLIDGILPKAVDTSGRKPVSVSLKDVPRKPVSLDAAGQSVALSDKTVEVLLPEKQAEAAARNAGEAAAAVVRFYGNHFGNVETNQLVFPCIASDRCLAYAPVVKDAEGTVSRGIAVIDLSQSRVVNSYIEQTGGQPVAISPDGSRFILQYRRSAGTRLDVMETGTGRGAARQLAGWVPYPVPRSKKSTNNLRWTAMPSSDFVLTLSDSGDLIGWQLPDLKPVYTIAGVKGEPMLSPGGGQVFFYANASVYCADVRTGKMLADVTGELPTQQNLRFAVNPQGTQVAVMYPSRRMCYIVQVYSIGEPGKPRVWEYYMDDLPRAYAGDTSRRFMYMAENHLILPSGLMIDTTSGSPVANYQLPENSITIAMGRVWRLVRKMPEITPAGARHIQNENTLESVRVPSENVMQLGKSMSRADFVVCEAPRNVRVDFSPPAEVSNGDVLRQRVLAIIRDSGYVIDDNSPIVFRIHATMQPNPEVVYRRQQFGFRRRGGNDDNQKYEGKKIVGGAEVIMDGKQVWSTRSITSSPMMITRVPDDADLNAVIVKATWERYPSLAEHIAEQIPALLMDYSRLEKVAPWSSGESISGGNEAGAVAKLTPEIIQRYETEIRVLKAFRASAGNWGEKALALHNDTVGNKNDAKKFRQDADDIQRDTRLVGNVTDPIAESSLEVTKKLRASALEISRLYQQAYRVAAQRQAGVRVRESPDSLVAQAKGIYDKQFVTGLEQIDKRVKELEEVLKNAPKDGE